MPQQHHQATNKQPKRKKKSSSSNLQQLQQWLDSFEAVSAAIEQHGDLLQLLSAGGGICKIDNFLPGFVAEGIYQTLEQFGEADWNVTAADDDYTHNNISHDFLSTKSLTLEAVFRVFTLLLPDALFTFSAAKYCKQGHIKPHDDRAYTQVRMEDGSIQLCSRSIAVIYYLTKDWTAADGGLLIDHEAPGGPQTHIPKFNSVIAFTIPRWHEVTPVVGNRPRYSVFGWFLEPGKLYELQLDPQLPSQEQLQQRHKQQHKQKKKKKTNAAAAPPTAEQEQATGPNAASSPDARSGKKRKKHKQQHADGSQQELQQPPQQQQQQQRRRKKERKQAGDARLHAVEGAQLVAGSIAPGPKKQQLPGLKKSSKHS